MQEGRPVALTRRDWMAIAGIAFAVRIASAVWLDAFRSPQLSEYDDLARSVWAGHGFQYDHLGITYHSFAAPLYSWICAALYWATGGSVAAVLLMQMLVSAVHAAVTASMAVRLFHERTAGMTAGLLFAVHPGLIIYSSLKGDPLAFNALFFMLVCLQFWRWREEGTLGRAAITGVIAGIGMLSRATTAVFLPLGGAWLLWTSPSSRRIRLGRQWLAAVACAGLIVLPWTIRNILVNREFVFIQTTDGELFWRGNNPEATGHSYVDASHLVLDTLTPADQRELRALPTETAQSRWFRARAWAFIEAHPGEFVRLTLTKFFHFWWFSRQTGTLYARAWLRGYQAYYVLIVALAALGVWWASREGDQIARQRLVLMLLFLILLAGLQSLYYVEGRHRWAVEPFLLVLAGGGTAFARVRLRRALAHGVRHGA